MMGVAVGRKSVILSRSLARVVHLYAMDVRSVPMRFMSSMSERMNLITIESLQTTQLI